MRKLIGPGLMLLLGAAAPAGAQAPSYQTNSYAEWWAHVTSSGYALTTYGFEEDEGGDAPWVWNPLTGGVATRTGGEYMGPDSDKSAYYPIHGESSIRYRTAAGDAQLLFTLTGGPASIFGIYVRDIDSDEKHQFHFYRENVFVAALDFPPVNAGDDGKHIQFMGATFADGGFDEVRTVYNCVGCAETVTGSIGYDDVSLGVWTTSAVPEPSTIILLGTGLLAIASIHRRRRDASS